MLRGRDREGRPRARAGPAAPAGPGPRVRIWRPARPPRRALVVHPWGLGDWLLFEPALRSLRAAYPALEIDVYLHQPGAAAMVEALGGVARTFARPGGAAGLLALAARLRARRYDLALATTGYRIWKSRAFLLAVGARATVAEWRRTPVGLAGAVRASDALHQVEANLALAVAAGAAPVDPPWPRFPIRPAGAAAADRWLAEHGLSGAEGRRLAFFHPGGSRRYPHKRWPLARFEGVARALAARGFETIAVLGPDEPELADALARFRPPPRVATGLALGALAALLARAAVYFGGDSAMAHVAAAVGAPTVAVLGPTDPARTAPYGPNAVHVVHGGLACQPCYPRLPAGCPPMTCVNDLPAAAVLAAIDAVAGARRGA